MRRATAAAVLVLLLAGCGVPLSDGPDPVPGLDNRPTTSATSSVPASPPVTTASVWWVDGERLVPRTVQAPAPLTSVSAVELLATAPPEASGVRTLVADPVGGPPLASVPEVQPTGPVQAVTLSPTFAELSAPDQVLLIGQVVLTLTEIERTPILFVDSAGQPLSVPLPDGRLRDGPVTRGDYLGLT